jgi:hypothetical protein
MQDTEFLRLATPDEPAALAYIEKFLADSYRKEIDQEENVWRSLPFFAATLALQLAALFQVIDKLPDPGMWIGAVALAVLSMAAMQTLLSLCFLAASIYPQRFQYAARQTALLDYARDLIRHEADTAATDPSTPFSALITLKTDIATQFAQATDHNQRLNKRREQWRSVAGLCALGSVLMTIFLVVATSTHYLTVRTEKQQHHADTPSAECHAPAGHTATERGMQSDIFPRANTAADAGRHEGVVGPAGGAEDGRGTERVGP